MRFEHITYEEKTGKNSKQIETYNFHKAAIGALPNMASTASGSRTIGQGQTS